MVFPSSVAGYCGGRALKLRRALLAIHPHPKGRGILAEESNDSTNSNQPGSLKFFLDEAFLSSYSKNYEPSDRQRFYQDFDELVVVAQLSCGGEATVTSIKA